MATVDPRAQNIITCDLCSSQVELYCNSCHVNLCALCAPKHMESKSSKRHNVVLYRERLLEPVHPECALHSEQHCEMFCKSCDVPICVTCVIGSHKKHDFISIEENILESMKAIIEADNRELEDAIIPTYTEIDSEISEQTSNLVQEYDEVQKNIDENGVKWHKEIDIVIQKQKNEAQIMKDRNLDTVNNHQAEVRDILSLARDIFRRNKDLLKSIDVAQIKNYKSRNEELRTVPRRITWTLPSFTPVRIDEKHLYRQFGELKAAIESEIEELEIKMKRLTKPEVDVSINAPTHGLIELSYLPVDKMWIRGIEEEGIELINIQGTVLDSLSGKMARGLTVTKEGHLIYGIKDIGKINIVKNGETIIRMPHGWGIYSTCITLSDDLLILMYKSPGLTECKVVRYDKEYKIKQEIQYNDKGTPLYTAAQRLMYIAENKNRDICVSNRNAMNVVNVNHSGKLRWVYTGNLKSHNYNSFGPEGLATDSQCHILVADSINHCVHVLDKDGRLLSLFSECGLSFPQALCIDKDDRLFVGESRKSGCSVKIIRFLK